MDIITEHARIIWDYLRLGHPLKRMDAICAFGSDSVHVAERAADLWLDGYGKYLIVSGGQPSRFADNKSEADRYADIAYARGIPRDRILIEDKASNTGENVLFVRDLLARSNFTFTSFLLVQKPYMERRVYATFCKLWPEAECIVTSPQISFEKYTRNAASRDRLARYLVNTLFRISTYSARGFQIPQDIPPNVRRSWESLVALGYETIKDM